MSTRIQILLNDDTIDDLAKMMIGYVLGMDKEMPNYQRKVEVVVEFLEEVMDPSFESVAVYLRILDLMPGMVKRKLPYRIEEFVRMYQRQVEEKLVDLGGIPAKYKPKIIEVEEKKLILPNGSTISLEAAPSADPLVGLNPGLIQ
jgi:hypothetical protein